VIRSVLMLAPEPPYPLHGGGAYRTASLVHYFARFAEVDLILFSESGKPALLPRGLVRSQNVIQLPAHGKGLWERYRRNARRALFGVPPLIDRLSGFETQLRGLLAGRSYDLGIVEHFWCAAYIDEMETVCERTLLDLHNLESVLSETCGDASRGLVSLGQRRFATAARRLETKLLPRYSAVLATSEDDASRAAFIAPEARLTVYPNALPQRELPRVAEEWCLVFSANFEYHPNIDAVEYFVSEIWPTVGEQYPDLQLKLVGRGDSSIRHLIPGHARIEASGPVEDAFHEIAKACVVVAPLRAGSGTRIKILEAWAAARAVVATPLAAEGLAVEDGANILLAKDPAQFAAGIDRLLKNEVERQRMGENGRQTFLNLYTWEKAWQGLDQYLQSEWSVELNRYTE
jgi:glycosyltransferase involved in cell wall biosynthesis